MTNNIGNPIEASSPALRSLLNTDATLPVTYGPREQPKSPEKANNANNAVPPYLICFDANENVPGHIIPTEKPHNAQPTNPIIADEDKEAKR